MDQFIGEIRVFPFSLIPSGWAPCIGQIMPIRQNTALFSVLGTTYGGDGTNTFGLPDLKGRVPLMPGQGDELSAYTLGQQGGADTVKLTTEQMPAHTHSVLADNLDPADLNVPSPRRVLALSQGVGAYQPSVANPVPLAPQALTVVGNGQPHDNMMPSLTLNFCIALVGNMPTRRESYGAPG
ncbi:phage tail protein [Deinococcus radiotolerans]|uniref:Tail Collar domain-containing protein n=1 Tax=Deinococcus radiotolerans TaxID=1309407 RepID=A0ABQ2FRE6_9DEIO|nr:tail fiber protein [Deinococcus radiotolerans]GGL19401.1 tail Collar domain-containing protein [Deinococcus radiotolerans]